MPNAATVGRLAPSPTGGLHLGHARTFFLAWLSARQQGGRLILRIEDLDASRVRAEAFSSLLIDLGWLGLDWDEGPNLGGPNAPYLQSQRFKIYQEALYRLQAAGLVYTCTCSRADIARASSAPHAEDEGPTYPGTCALMPTERVTQNPTAPPYAWRFRVPDHPIRWLDQVAGPVDIDPRRRGGDFVLARSDAGPSYQLAVVVDDALMGVNQVIRGDDLLPSTPRQLLLYQALDWPAPTFCHVPLALGPDGRRLAKRDQSIKLATLREQGVDPTNIIAAIARSCGLTANWSPTHPRHWLGLLSWEKLPVKPWVITEALLAEIRDQSPADPCFRIS